MLHSFTILATCNICSTCPSKPCPNALHHDRHLRCVHPATMLAPFFCRRHQYVAIANCFYDRMCHSNSMPKPISFSRFLTPSDVRRRCVREACQRVIEGSSREHPARPILYGREEVKCSRRRSAVSMFGIDTVGSRKALEIILGGVRSLKVARFQSMRTRFLKLLPTYYPLFPGSNRRQNS